jgi:HEAT repeat protein
MRLRYRHLLVLLPILTGVTAWLALRHPEPAYQGKRLSQWIAEIKAGDTNHPADFGRTAAQREAIQAMGLEALPMLLEAVNYELWWQGPYRWGHARLLANLFPHLSAPVWPDADRESAFRSEVVADCQRLRPRSEPLLIRALGHSRPEVRAMAARALAGQTNVSPEVFSALTNCIRDWNLEVRQHVLEAIACFGPAASNAVPAIAEHILRCGPPTYPEYSDEERAWAAIALSKLGSGAVAAVPILQEGAEQRTNSYFRVSAEIALWRIRHHPSDVLPALLTELDTFDVRRRWMIFECLGELGPRAAVAVPVIVGFLDSTLIIDAADQSYNRQVALEALRKIAPDEAEKWQRKTEPPKP